MKKLTAILFLLLFFLNVIKGQEMLGIISSNYAGIYGLRLNPSLTPTSRLYMDYNLLGLQGFVDNNYAYVSRDDFIGIVFRKEEPVYYTIENERRNFTINRDNSLKHGFENSYITGPGAMLVNGKHGFGLTTALRSISSFDNLPPDVANFLYEAIDFNYQHGINYVHDKDLKVASMSWFELGINYAYIIKRYKWDYLSVGINLKPLFGTSGFYTKIDHVDYIVHNDTSATVYDATFSYGLSLPVNYSTSAYEPAPVFKGSGIGVDLGITYMFTRKGNKSYYFTRLCEQFYEAYNFKLGLSLLDLGFIRFSKKAINKSFEHNSTYWYKPYDTLPNSSINNLVYKIDSYFRNSLAGETNTSESFVMTLPPTLSLQGDLWLQKDYYLNLLVYYPLKVFRNNYFYRPTIISIAPRYETARFEVSLPLSVYDLEFAMPRIGFSFRYGNFFFGIDRLNNYFGISDFTGIDFYAGIRMNLSNTLKLNFIKGNCGMQKVNNIETFDYRNF